MKKLKYLLMISFLTIIGINKVGATPSNPAFKDDNFYKCVIENYNKNFKTDYDVSYSLTKNELESITSLTCSNKNIIDTSGIEKLINLKILYLYDNDIKSIDLSKNVNLSSLSMDHTLLESINLNYNKNLTFLNLVSTNISKIDLTENIKLESLYIGNDNLSVLDLSKNTNLKTLLLYNNNIKELDLSKNGYLKDLFIVNDKLTKIDLSKNINLQMLQLFNNKIKYIDLSNSKEIEYVRLSKDDTNFNDYSLPTDIKLIVSNKIYQLNNNYVVNGLYNNVNEFKKNGVDIYNKNGNIVKENEIIKTGYYVKQSSNQYFSVKGDVNGDGEITFLDVTKAYKIYKLKDKDTKDYEKLAADVSGNDLKVTFLDVIKLYKAYKGKDTF